MVQALLIMVCAHPLLAAHDAAVHVGQVTQLQTGRALDAGVLLA